VTEICLVGLQQILQMVRNNGGIQAAMEAAISDAKTSRRTSRTLLTWAEE
jgi:hypothetical protein